MPRYEMVFIGLATTILLVGVNLFLTDPIDKAVSLYDKKDFKGALKGFSKLCNSKNAQACYNLALMYQKGIGIKKDIQKSKRFFHKACILKYASACYYLASLEKNIKDAYSLYMQACQLSDYESCFLVGSLYYYNSKKEQEGIMLLKSACTKKYTNACFTLGNIYHDDRPIKDSRKKHSIFNIEQMYHHYIKKRFDKNLEHALAYYKKACDLRSAKACFRLANMYENNEVLEKNEEAQSIYYKRACKWGFKEACKKF